MMEAARSSAGDGSMMSSRAEESPGARRMVVAVVIFDYFFLGLFFVHALPWLVAYGLVSRVWQVLSCGMLGDPMAGPDYLEDGRVNAPRWLWSLYLNYGSTLSAFLATNFAGAFVDIDLPSFGISIGYVSWFGSIAVLATLNFIGEWRAGRAAREQFADRSWVGSALLRAFGASHEVRGGQAFVDVLIAASLLPAIVIGFLAFWYATPHYGLRCSPRVDSSELCNTIKGNRVCCRVVNTKYDVGEFVPYLVAYVIAGYYCARLLVVLLIARHTAHGSDLEIVAVDRHAGIPIPRLSTRTAFPLPSPHEDVAKRHKHLTTPSSSPRPDDLEDPPNGVVTTEFAFQCDPSRSMRAFFGAGLSRR